MAAAGPGQGEWPWVACFYVTKHSWRGKYKRLFCVGPDSVATLNPTTFEETNKVGVMFFHGCLSFVSSIFFFSFLLGLLFLFFVAGKQAK